MVFLAQASVSERVATLEKLIGTKLLDRLGRQILPTAAGKLLYKHACLLLEMKKTACEELQDFLGTRKGEIHISGSTIPGEYIFPGLLKKFCEKYPLVTVSLTISNTLEIAERVINGDFELGIIGSKNNNANLICRELWLDELVLAVPAKHKWTTKKQISLNDLVKEPFILRGPGSGTLKIINQYLEKTFIKDATKLNVVAYLDSSTAVKEGIIAGLGISILSLKALKTELKAGILKVIAIKNLDMPRKFYLIRDKRRNISPFCRAMLDFLISTADTVII